MKPILIFLILFSTNSCSQNNQIIKIEYKATTRGAFKFVSVSKNECRSDFLNKKSAYKTPKKDWDVILNLLDQININEIENLDRPSEISSTDRAMAASILITFKNKTIESSFFDDGNPPKELKKIVAKLLSLVSE